MAYQAKARLEASSVRASTLVAKYSLEPPVDISALLSEFADVSYAPWPYDCDAVTLFGKGRPKVWVKSGLSDLRCRFTLGHELGHIQLAWHSESIFCTPGQDDPYLESETRDSSQEEREANLFASELLVPPDWVSSGLPDDFSFGVDGVRSILSHLEKAKVSAQAGIISISRALLPGHAIFLGDRFALSRGTSWPGSAPLSQAEIREYLSSAHKVHEVEHQGQRIIWAEMIPPVLVSEVSDALDGKKPFSVLKEICLEVYPEGEAMRRARSINGVVGGLLSDKKRKWTPESVISVISARVGNNSANRAALEHPHFPSYLHGHALSVLRRR
ncbi:ImmA/IrrE family metallo-endopeptidase [Nocardiopsis sp. NPDC058631]|uniref:ImmA/IrrE family metallo-endopeptidase n=1 Tax=Nocardiopsis sp. NPDC058631 TaxID=3346566 RepID=UPI003669DA41